MSRYVWLFLLIKKFIKEYNISSYFLMCYTITFICVKSIV